MAIQIYKKLEKKKGFPIKKQGWSNSTVRNLKFELQISKNVEEIGKFELGLFNIFSLRYLIQRVFCSRDKILTNERLIKIENHHWTIHVYFWRSKQRSLPDILCFSVNYKQMSRVITITDITFRQS